MIRTSIPKISSFRLKNGIQAKNIEIHPNKYDSAGNLHNHIMMVIDGYGANLSKAEIIGVLEFVKLDIFE